MADADLELESISSRGDDEENVYPTGEASPSRTDSASATATRTENASDTERTAAVVSTETGRSEASVRRETTRTEQSEMNRTIIEEPPPHYSSLFPPKTNNIPHVSRQQPPCQPQHESSHHQIRHSQPTPQYPNHCSVCYTALPAAHSNLHHCHLHHTANPLPGAIGHHYPAHHIPRELTQQHSTILPIHPRNGFPDEPTNHDTHMRLSFALVVLCALHLNLPALLCVLPALAHSIKAQKLNAEGYHRQAQWYSRRALTCNIVAIMEFVILVVAVLVVVFVVVGFG